jgi:flagellar hook-associated protein 1 FlgK
LFDIARLAISANRAALQVTGHNISNVNTPGYTRQRAVLATSRPVSGNPGQIGTGVNATEISRIYDKYLEFQVTTQKEYRGKSEILSSLLGRMEETFNESSGAGLNKAVSDFFGATSDLAADPAGSPPRTALLGRGQTLANVFNRMYEDLTDQRRDIDRELRGTLTQVNDLAGDIADLNDKIAAAELVGQNANDLRDQRQVYLNELAEYVDVNAFEDSIGMLNVFIGGDRPLVLGKNAASLTAVDNADNSGFAEIGYVPFAGSTITITSAVRQGKLAGLVQARDTDIPDALDQLNALAAAVTYRFNDIHDGGYGLDGSTGNEFFNDSNMGVSVTVPSTNTGTAAAGTLSITSVNALEYHNYRISFAVSGPTTYTITDLADNTTVATGAYTNPTTFAFNGLSVQITGVPANGDTLEVSAHKDAAQYVSLTSTVLNDRNKIAAAGANPVTTTGPSDNDNALLLAALKDTKILTGGTETLSAYYSSLTADVGSTAAQGKRDDDFYRLTMEQLENRRESVSGVSLDEEGANLIKFQRAFEAAAKLVQTADDLLITVLNLKR